MKGSLLKIHFDGCGDEHDRWLDANCPHLFPVGWCERFQYQLQTFGTDNTADYQEYEEITKDVKLGSRLEVDFYVSTQTYFL